MNYLVTGEQLTSIADAIRARQYNLFDSRNTAFVKGNNTYIVTATLTWNGTQSGTGFWATEYGEDGVLEIYESNYYATPPAQGTVEPVSIQFKTNQSTIFVKAYTKSGLILSNLRLYLKSNAGTNPIEFPIGFISAIQNI